MQNPFLVLKENYYNMDSTKPVVESDNSINKLESLGFTYDGNTETYTKVDNDGGVIEYKTSSKIISKELITNGYRHSIRYSVKRNVISYKIIDKDNLLIMDLIYYVDLQTLKCSINNCKSYHKEIDYILSVYNEIMSVL